MGSDNRPTCQWKNQLIAKEILKDHMVKINILVRMHSEQVQDDDKVYSMLRPHNRDEFHSISESSTHYPAAVFWQDLQPIFQLLFSICPSVRPRRPSGSGQDHFTRDTGSRVSLLQWIFNQTPRSHWTNDFLFLTVGWELELHAGAAAVAGGCRELGNRASSSSSS